MEKSRESNELKREEYRLRKENRRRKVKKEE